MKNKLQKLSQNLEEKDRDMETIKENMIQTRGKVERRHIIGRELQQRSNAIETRIKDRIPELKTDLHMPRKRPH